MGRIAQPPETYWTPSELWLTEFDKFKAAAIRALAVDNLSTDHATAFAESLGVHKTEISNFRNGKRPGDGNGSLTHSDTVAENLIKGLSAENPTNTGHVHFAKLWANWRTAREALAADFSTQCNER
jgi:hypothetical protein